MVYRLCTSRYTVFHERDFFYLFFKSHFIPVFFLKGVSQFSGKILQYTDTIFSNRTKNKIKKIIEKTRTQQ